MQDTVAGISTDEYEMVKGDAAPFQNELDMLVTPWVRRRDTYREES